jgi:type IX secretion system PorP/SprF family membrane protein
MILMKKIVLFVGLFFAFLTARGQQDAQFSQYIFDGIYINPAYTGYKEDLNLNTFDRSQWTGLTGAPETFALAGDVAVNDGKVGLGLLLNRDQIGAQSTTAVYTNYSYRIELGRQEETSWLSFGLGVGILQSSLDGSQLYAAQAGDNVVPTGFQSTVLPDARVGILYTTDNFFAGASVDNLLAKYMHETTSNLSLIAIIPQPHRYFTIGGLFDLNDDTKLKPSILVKDAQGAPTSVDFNTFVLLSDRLWLGGTYRTGISFLKKNLQTGLPPSSALVAMAEFFVNPDFRVGYAFDYSLNALGAYGYGSHELSISILIKTRRDVDRSRKCYF